MHKDKPLPKIKMMQ